MRTIRLTALMLFFIGFAAYTKAQTNLISNNKSLAIYNPAIQNVEFDKGFISLSYLPTLRDESADFTNYLALAEFKINEAFRMGLHSGQVETRLNKFELTKFYTSYKFNLEAGNYFLLGVELGYYKDMAKVAEFNKVFAPTKTIYTDSVSSNLDVGVGMAFATENFIIGASLGRINAPQIVPFPRQQWALRIISDTIAGTTDSAYVKQDTSIQIGKKNFVNSKIQSNINMIFSYDVSSNVKITHSLSMANIDLDGVDFIGLQNFVTFNEKLIVGLGIFDNSDLGFMGSVGFNVTKSIKLEVASFFVKQYDFNPDAKFPYLYLNNQLIDAKGAYESVGYVPTIEGNLRIQF